MPKGFSDKEKSIIQEALLEKGHQLFCTYGLKKTGIAEITKAVGIAQGSFYSFYESKEELYFDILEREEQKFKEQLLAQLAPLYDKPKEFIRALFTSAFKQMEENTLLMQIYDENTVEILSRRLSPERLAKHLNSDSADLQPLLAAWQQKGIVLRADLETITGLMRAVFLLTLHKKEIGEGVFEKALDLLIELVSEGIILKEV